MAELPGDTLTAHAARLRYDEPMLRRAVRAFMWRRVLTRPLVIVVAIITLVVAIIVATQGLDDTFVSGLFAACLLLFAVGIVAIWRAHTRNTIGRFRAMDPPEADVTFSDAGAAFSSNIGAATLPWTRFKEVWEFPDFWMLFTSEAGFNVIPIASMDAETVAFARRKLAEVATIWPPRTGS